MYNNTINVTNGEIDRPKTYGELQEMALEIRSPGMKSSKPGSSGEKFIHIPNKKGCFYRNDGIYAWVTKDGRYFVSPYFDGIENILHTGELHKEDLYVPLSNGDKPSGVSDYCYWQQLRDAAKAWRWEDVRAEAKSKCEAGNVPKVVLRHCLEVPIEGMVFSPFLRVKPMMVAPLLTSPRLDDNTSMMLGTYIGGIFGTLCVVTNDGRTLIWDRYPEDIIEKLERSGYRRDERIMGQFSECTEIEPKVV
jgi:hypothetical protein